MAFKHPIAGLTRAARKRWFNADVAGDEKSPLLCNNESLDAVNAANTGVIPVIKVDASDAVNLLDTAGNEVVKLGTTASAVNELTVTNAAAAGTVALAATGGDTNIPIRLSGKGTGSVQLGQATSTDVRLVADQPIADSSGNELIKFTKAASAVNEITVSNAATGAVVSIKATGGDADVPVWLASKGTSAVYLGQSGCQGIGLYDTSPIMDANNANLFKFTATPNAVNEFTVANAATGNAPALSATGDDANIGVTVATKGTGNILANVGSTNRLVVNGAAKTIEDASATGLFSVALADNTMVGGMIFYTVEASDATEFQALTGMVTYAAVAKVAVHTLTITEVAGNQAKAVSGGTLTLAWTFVTGANVGTVKVQPTGSLAETTYRITYTVVPLVGNVTIV